MRNLKSTVALLALVTGFIAAVPTIALAQSAPTVTGVEGCLTSNLNVVSWGGGYGSPNISIQYLGPGFNYYTGVNSTPGTFGDETIAAGTYIYSGSVANYDNWVATTQNGVDPLMGIATGSHGYGAPSADPGRTTTNAGIPRRSPRQLPSTTPSTTCTRTSRTRAATQSTTTRRQSVSGRPTSARTRRAPPRTAAR